MFLVACYVSFTHIFSQDVMICDFKKEVFVWIGQGASEAELQNGMAYAHVSTIRPGTSNFFSDVVNKNTVELRWLEHLWDHEN